MLKHEPSHQSPTSETEPLHILQFVTTLRRAGAEKLAVDLSISLREHGHDVTVAAHTDDTDSLADQLRDHDVEVVPVAFPKPGLRKLLHTVSDLRRVIRSANPDIIHAHNPAAATIARAAKTLAWRRKVPVVVTYHGVRPHRIRLAGHLISGADALIAVGPSAAAQLRATLPRERVVEIKNAVVVERTRSDADVREEFGIAEGGALLASVGRYVPQKGQSLLIDTAAELRDRGSLGPAFKLVIVGHGPLMEELGAQAASLGVEEYVTLTGERADANDIVGAADVLVHGANWEGLPLVLLEAMSLGVPIVAVDAPGVDDIIHDHTTGLLVKHRDPKAMADAVEEMLGDDALGQTVVAGARALVERDYLLESMVAEHTALYRSLVATRSTPR